MTTMLSQIEKEIYIAGRFSEMKIIRLFLCPDIQKETANNYVIFYKMVVTDLQQRGIIKFNQSFYKKKR